VPRLDADLQGVEVEVLYAETSDLVGPQARLSGEPVEQIPFVSGYAVEKGGCRSGLQQPFQLVGVQRSAHPPAIHAGVDVLEMLDGRGGRASVLDHPPAELLERLEVVVVGLGADAVAVIPQARKIVLKPAGLYVRPQGKPAPHKGLADSIGGQARMFHGISAVQKGLPELRQVLQQGSAAMLLVAVNDSLGGKCCFLLQASGHLLRGLLVRVTLDPLLDAIGVEVLHIPALRLLLDLLAIHDPVVFPLKHTRHSVTSSS